MRAAVTTDGTMLGLDVTILADFGAYACVPGTKEASASAVASEGLSWATTRPRAS